MYYFPTRHHPYQITSVGRIDRLIVLDIKWTRKHKDIPLSLHKIQKVHLVSPPTTSHFWRWHNAGQGCLSTIEAIYFASMEYTLLLLVLFAITVVVVGVLMIVND